MKLQSDTTELNSAADFLIVGAGVCGLTVALALRSREPSAQICIVEREREVGLHASGRNSGVLHAGIYYDSSSMKARFCREGSLRMQEFCREFGLSVVKSGKVIVPSAGATKAELLRLKTQADANGVRTEMIDRKQLAELEPYCAPFTDALYSPDTASVDPKQILSQLVKQVRAAGIKLQMSCQIRQVDDSQKRVMTTTGTINFGRLINCAGAGSLAVAKTFGLGKHLRLMPFRGSYYELPSDCVKGNIYPVPDPRFPFLGVHASRAVSGRIFAGPSAWPLLRPDTFAVLTGEYLSDRGGMRRHMHEEIKNHFPGTYLRKLQELLPSLRRDDLVPRAKSGVRAQLYDTNKRKLVTDFVIEQTPASVHVLNMISPGFTCAFSFAEFLAEFIVTPLSDQE